MNKELNPDLDIFMYAGKWYVIAKLHNLLEISCYQTTVNYYVDDRPLQRGEPVELDIVNTCYNENRDIIYQEKARGWIPYPDNPAALMVEFTDNPFKEWHLVHETDYINYSVVGSPDRHFLWILSRYPEMCVNMYDKLLDFIEKIGYDTSRVQESEGALIECPYGPIYSTDIPRGNTERSYSPESPKIPPKILKKVKKYNYPVAIVRYYPFLIIDGNDFLSDVWTGNKKLDEYIDEEMSKDSTNVKGILKYIDIADDTLKATNDFWYDKPYFYHVIERKDKGEFTKENLDNIRENVDPYNTGPDTWMEGDINIWSSNDLQEILGDKGKEKFIRDHGENYENAELGVNVNEIYLYKP